MIRPLRQRHRRMFCALAVVLPLAFVVGVSARRSVPVAEPLLPKLTAQTSQPSQVVWTRSNLFPGRRIVTDLRKDAKAALALELRSHDVVRADVLVYWKPGDRAAEDKLTDAWLLGALSNGTPLSIPAALHGQSGRLVLYSLADHEVVVTSGILSLPAN